MKCYYEVLQVPRDVCADDLKKSYRKLALQFHPDKNLDNVEDATMKFKEIQQAYDVLSDPQERAWYDRHREEILQGMSDDFEDKSLNVFQYFNSSCYSGFNDGPKGFYTVYNTVFETIANEDLDYMDNKDSSFEIPSFGKSDSPYDEVVHEFYAYWQSYCTSKPYGWADKYDIRMAPNRRVLRLMEKENKKLRDQMRKKRNDEVRALVAFVRKRDKRVQAYRKLLEEKAAVNARKSEENRQKQIEEHIKQIEEYQESSWASMANLEHELKQIETEVTIEFGDKLITSFDPEAQNGYDDGEEVLDYDTLYCVSCDKVFKTEKAFANHENSKRHKENTSLLKVTMQEDDDNLFFGGTNNECNTGEQPFIELNVKESEDSLSDEFQQEKKKKPKRKKKNILQSSLNSTDQNEEDTGLEQDVADLADEDLSSSSTSISTKPPQGVKPKGKKAKEARHKTKIENSSEQDAPLIDDKDLSTTNSREPEEVKPKGKKAKDAKRKAKIETIANETEGPPLNCAVCGAVFPTRNKLFDHLKIKGHAVLVNSKPDPPSSSVKSKKKKGR